MDEIRRVAYCPHCGNRAPQKLVFTHSYEAVGYSTKDGTKAKLPSEYYIAICETCKELLLYLAFYSEGEAEYFDLSDLVYPAKTPTLHKSVPETVSNCYYEAAVIQKRAPNAYAVMIRRALEAICVDRGIKKGSLYERLKELATRGEIPPALAKMNGVLRVLGNVGAHNISQPITVPITWGMDELFRAVVEYVYVAPSKLSDFKQRLEEYNLHKET